MTARTPQAPLRRPGEPPEGWRSMQDQGLPPEPASALEREDIRVRDIGSVGTVAGWLCVRLMRKGDRRPFGELSMASRGKRCDNLVSAGGVRHAIELLQKLLVELEGGGAQGNQGERQGRTAPLPARGGR